MKSNLFQIKMMDGTEKLCVRTNKEAEDENLKIIDDFLKPEDYEVLRKMMMEDSSFQWQFGNGVNTPDDGYYQFCHVFYAQFEPRSLSSIISCLS